MGALTTALRATQERIYQRKLQASEQYLRQQANTLQGAMKQGHPWTNRTFAAERSLFAEVTVERTGTDVALQLTAGYGPNPGAPHGLFLELSHQGRWAVVGPTMQRNWRAIAKGVQEARRRVTK